MGLDLEIILGNLDQWGRGRVDQIGVDHLYRTFLAGMEAVAAASVDPSEKEMIHTYAAKFTPDSIKQVNSHLFSKAYRNICDLHNALAEGKETDPRLNTLSSSIAEVYEQIDTLARVSGENLSQGLPLKEAIDKSFTSVFPTLDEYGRFSSKYAQILAANVRSNIEKTFSGSPAIEIKEKLDQFDRQSKILEGFLKMHADILYADLYKASHN